MVFVRVGAERGPLAVASFGIRNVAKRVAITGAIAAIAVVSLAANAHSGAIDWAFPGAGPPSPAKPASLVHRLPGSGQAYREAQIHDLFHAVDWRPESHATPPPIVLQGRPPGAMACGFCHLPDGRGRPENASLAGLPADYIIRQVADFRAGRRRGALPTTPTQLMATVAAAASDDEVKAAATWFAAQPFAGHTRVVETATAPRAIAASFVYRFDPKAPRKALGARILEGPDDFERFELRDGETRYTAYVPPGAIARGERLAATGGGRTQVCAGCHGVGLKGGVGPPLAGRSPTAIFRQLAAFRSGARHGENAAPMRLVVARLTPLNMIALASYVGSLKP